MKLGILVFGVLGLVSAFIPIGELGTLFASANDQDGKAELIILLAGFAVPVAVIVMAIAKPPFQVWHAAAALGAFALVAVKFHIWEQLPHVFSIPFALKLFYLAQLGGLITSGIAVAKADQARA